ncbi:MAG: Gfo/Idh/MocA family oxidoreductase, partial [Candidatus Poribacteria bacterium]|nr:Gfo/Idh/MocA family oxidoreductase [Candidatus Poribacteria bacterium]
THLSYHVSALNAAPRVELVAAAAQNDAERELFQELGISTIYSSYDDMLANADLDIVEIDTNPIQLYEMTLAAAERGIHVLGEKPIAISLTHADEMVAACDRAGIQLAIYNIRRCDPYHIRAKRLLDEGYIGDLLTMPATSRSSNPSGHNLINLGTHLFDIARFFAGDAEWLDGYVTTDGKPATAIDIQPHPGGMGPMAGDKSTTTLGFKNGVTATVDFWRAEPEYFGIELIGTEGALAIRVPESPCPLMHRSDALWSDSPEDNIWQPIELPTTELAGRGPGSWDAVYRIAVEEFVRCIETGDEHPLSGAQAVKALELIQGTYESHRLGARVSIPLTQRRHPLEEWPEE